MFFFLNQTALEIFGHKEELIKGILKSNKKSINIIYFILVHFSFSYVFNYFYLTIEYIFTYVVATKYPLLSFSAVII